jgi:hypothetical protein
MIHPQPSPALHRPGDFAAVRPQPCAVRNNAVSWGFTDFPTIHTPYYDCFISS